MPWSSKQHRLFEAAAHDPGVAKRVGIPQADASRMASEGIKMAGGGLADVIRSLKNSSMRPRALRLEKAADLIPGLDKLYSPDALQKMSPYNFAIYDPAKFEHLSYPMTKRTPTGVTPFHSIDEADENVRIRDLRNLIRAGTPFDDVPELGFRRFTNPTELRVNDLRPDANALLTRGHEGRHRSRALDQEGIENALAVTHFAKEVPTGDGDYYFSSGYKMPRWTDMDTPTFPEGQYSSPIEWGDVFKTKPFARGGQARPVYPMGTPLAGPRPPATPLSMMMRPVGHPYGARMASGGLPQHKQLAETGRIRMAGGGFTEDFLNQDTMAQAQQNTPLYALPQYQAQAQPGWSNNVMSQIDPAPTTYAVGGGVPPVTVPHVSTTPGVQKRGQPITIPIPTSWDDVTKILSGEWKSMIPKGEPAPPIQYDPQTYKPPRYADGGDVDPYLTGLGLAGSGIGALAAFAPKRFNMLARPIQRAMAKPVIAAEAVSNRALSPVQSDVRYALARANLDHPFSQLPVQKGQGAWLGEKGLETNPLYMTQAPRTMGPMSKNTDALNYAGLLGQALDQQAVPVSRVMPNIRNVPDEATNALLANKVTAERIKQLAQMLGGDTVVAHRPGDKAMMFSLNNEPITDLAKRAEAILGRRPRFAVSQPGKDRMLVGREPWTDVTYDQLGITPASQGYRNLEENYMNHPSIGNTTYAKEFQ